MLILTTLLLLGNDLDVSFDGQAFDTDAFDTTAFLMSSGSGVTPDVGVGFVRRRRRGWTPKA